MLWVRLVKTVKDLPYKVGMNVPVSRTNDGRMLWHVCIRKEGQEVRTIIIELPPYSYTEVPHV